MRRRTPQSQQDFRLTADELLMIMDVRRLTEKKPRGTEPERRTTEREPLVTEEGLGITVEERNFSAA
jgi:hypothetical protein